MVDAAVTSERAASKPVFADVSPDSVTPYSDAILVFTDTQQNLEHVKRPLNTFMVFARLMRSKLPDRDRLNHAVVNKRLGEHWKTYT